MRSTPPLGETEFKSPRNRRENREARPCRALRDGCALGRMPESGRQPGEPGAKPPNTGPRVNIPDFVPGMPRPLADGPRVDPQYARQCFVGCCAPRFSGASCSRCGRSRVPRPRCRRVFAMTEARAPSRRRRRSRHPTRRFNAHAPPPPRAPDRGSKGASQSHPPIAARTLRRPGRSKHCRPAASSSRRPQKSPSRSSRSPIDPLSECDRASNDRRAGEPRAPFISLAASPGARGKRRTWPCPSPAFSASRRAPGTVGAMHAGNRPAAAREAPSLFALTARRYAPIQAPAFSYPR